MAYGYFRPYPEIPRALYRNRNTTPRVVPPGVYSPGTVYAINGATTATVLAMAEDHYGVSTLDALAAKLDPYGPRSMEDFCQAWWGKPFADCIYEILLYDRILQWVRQSSYQQSPLTKDFPLWYGGGDVMDTCVVSSGARVWVGGDTLIALIGYVDLHTNETKINSLPARNHWATEFVNGAVDRFGTTRTADALGAGFASMQGSLASFVTPNQTTYPGTIYWCTAITPSAAADRVAYVAAWLVKVPTPGTAVYDHELLDTHILHIHTFGVPIEIGTFDVGAGGNFWADDFLVDTTHTYVYAKEYDPSFGDFTPNWGQDLDTDTIYRHVARIPAGTEPTATGHTGSTFTSYEWWTGTTWSSDITQSARLVDTGGSAIRGDSGVGKIATNHYVLVAQDPMEKQKRVYFSTTPQGPWWHYRNVPAPIFGTDVIPTNVDRTSFNTKVHVDFPAPTDRVMTMCTANGNTFATASSPSSTYSKAGRHVAEIDVAYYLSVPTVFGDHVPPPPSNVHRMRPLLVR